MLSYRDQEGRTKSLIRFLALWINTSSNNILVSFKVTLVSGIFVKMPNLCAFFPSFTSLDVTLNSSFVMMSTDIPRLGHGPFSLLLLFLPLPPPAPNHLLPQKKSLIVLGQLDHHLHLHWPWRSWRNWQSRTATCFAHSTSSNNTYRWSVCSPYCGITCTYRRDSKGR